MSGCRAILLALLSLPSCYPVPGSTDAFKVFVRNRAWYEAQLREWRAREASGAINEQLANANANVRAVLGPPLRVAWRLDGPREEWSGIVYDSTGLVAKVDDDARWDRDSILVYPGRRTSIRWMFGDRLSGCQRLEGPWWRCMFL